MWRRTAAAILTLGCILPAACLVVLSCARDWIFPRLLPPHLTALHWAAVFTGASRLGSSLLLSAAIAFTVALLSTACGFLTSRAIARHPRRALFVLLAHFPFAMSPVILGTCLLYLFIRLQLAGTMMGGGAGPVHLCLRRRCPSPAPTKARGQEIEPRKCAVI